MFNNNNNNDATQKVQCTVQVKWMSIRGSEAVIFNDNNRINNNNNATNEHTEFIFKLIFINKKNN